MQTQLIFEQLTAKTHNAQLPPVWAVLYYEGMRGNHIAFPTEIVKLVTRRAQRSSLTLKPKLPEATADVALGMLRCPSIPALRQYVAGLSRDRQLLAFQVYLRILKSWQNYLRENLN